MTNQEKITFLKSMPHKLDVNPHDWDHVHSNLLTLAMAYCCFCIYHGIPVLFTSIIRPMLPQSETDIHAKKRAFDASANGWDTDLMDEFIIDANKIYKEIAAVSIKDGIPRAYIFHGEVLHLHAQVHP